MRVFFVLLCLVCFFPFGATAHTSGASLEQVVGEYIVDIGYDPPDIAPGDRIVFDLNLFEEISGEKRGVSFDSAWVRITSEDETIFATGIAHARFGATTLLYVPPEDFRNLSFEVRFERAGETLAEATFELPVSNDQIFPYFGENIFFLLLSVLVLVVGGCVLLWRMQWVPSMFKS